MKYNFDQPIQRQGSNSYKWNLQDKDMIPLWIADMDFQAPKPVRDAVIKRAEHGIYGYYILEDGFYQAVYNCKKKRHGWEIHKD